MKLALGCLGLLLALSVSSGVAPATGGVSYGVSVGPAFVWGHWAQTPEGCQGGGGASVLSDNDGPRRVVTEDRLPGCGHVRVWVYEQPPASRFCVDSCPSRIGTPSLEEVRASWTLIAGPVDLG